jgi:long-chain fatty acid transport protein
MKKTIKLAVVAALALGATSAFATNGSELIGTGAKSRAMGGTAIGVAHGAESGLSNGALITSVEGTEVSFGGTVFMPAVSADMGMGAKDSAANMSVIPEISIANKISDNFYMGIGMWGTAGMGVDYRKETGYTSNFQMVTNLQLMQFGVPLAYATNGFSIGVTPVLQYGSLDMNFAGGFDVTNAIAGGMLPAGTSNPYPVSFGAGVSQDLKFGYNVGLAYEVSGLTIGASYKSQIDMEYTGQISGASQIFANFGMFGGKALSDKLSTPSEMGIGLSYEVSGNTIALDYKQIAWSSAEGYKDFKWEDQTVIALGYEYATKSWAARLGYNYANNPVKEQASGAGTMDTTGSAINMLNALGFPATVKSHMSIGGTYNLSDATSIDLAYVYAPKVTDTYTVAGFGNFGPMNPQSVTVEHSQTSVSFQLNYLF